MALLVLLVSLAKAVSLFFNMRFLVHEVLVLLPPLVPVDEGAGVESVSVSVGSATPLELGLAEPLALEDGEPDEEGSAEGSAEDEPPAASFTTVGPGNAYLALVSKT